MISKTAALRQSMMRGFMMGAFLGILHAAILAAGGMYSTYEFAEKCLSFSRYAGLLGLLGGIFTLTVEAIILAVRTLRMQAFAGLFPPILLGTFYSLLWTAFIINRYFGRTILMETAAAGSVISGVAILFVLRLLKKSGYGSQSAGAARGNKSAMIMVALILAGLYLSPELLLKDDEWRFHSKRESPATEVSRESPEKPEAIGAGESNLLLLTIDTLRWDHLGISGYPKPTSPVIDSLALSGFTFTQAYCQRPKTSPSFATILTGTYPARHGIVSVMQKLLPENKTMAEYLQEMGWSTAAVVTNGNLYPAFGFDQGFKDYIFGHKDAKTGADLAIKWLKKSSSGEPWFLWVHFTDPHTPYLPPPPYDSLFIGETAQAKSSVEYQVAQYDGEIRFVDHQLSRMLSAIRESGFADRTLVVFTADHGESLGEHGYYYEHGLYAYEPSARVPLVFSFPRYIPVDGSSDNLVGSVDILPTVLDILGVEWGKDVQGKTLFPAMLGLEGEQPNEFVYIEAGYGRHDVGGRTIALRKGDIKYIHRLTAWAAFPRGPRSVFWSMNARLEGGLARDELYDLAGDPYEMRNIIDDNSKLALEYKRLLKTFVRDIADDRKKTGAVPADFDKTTYEALKSLGYIK